MSRDVYHVVFKKEAWHVRRTRARRASGCHSRKAAAIMQAKALVSRRVHWGRSLCMGVMGRSRQSGPMGTIRAGRVGSVTRPPLLVLTRQQVAVESLRSAQHEIEEMRVVASSQLCNNLLHNWAYEATPPRGCAYLRFCAVPQSASLRR